MKTEVIFEFLVTSSFKILPILIKIGKEIILFVLVSQNEPIFNFNNDFIGVLKYLPTNYRRLVVCDFDLDKMLEENA